MCSVARGSSVGGKHPSWGAWLAIGAVVGVFAGAFFGGWAGFLAKAHVLDDVDAHVTPARVALEPTGDH